MLCAAVCRGCGDSERPALLGKPAGHGPAGLSLCRPLAAPAACAQVVRQVTAIPLHRLAIPLRSLQRQRGSGSTGARKGCAAQPTPHRQASQRYHSLWPAGRRCSARPAPKGSDLGPVYNTAPGAGPPGVLDLCIAGGGTHMANTADARDTTRPVSSASPTESVACRRAVENARPERGIIRQTSAAAPGRGLCSAPTRRERGNVDHPDLLR